MNNTPRWTHPSAKQLAPEGDPLETIVARARQITLDALEAGWAGPPFDPIELARFLRLKVEPCGDIAEARTMPVGDGSLLIQFNPHRSRGRVRYSIAHEIAHTFFPDCADAVRHRLDKQEIEGDDWQLEMLCNVAAAELLMPVGSFGNLRDISPSIDILMQLRRKYDVSIEAMLLRFVHLTPSPCALFAASCDESRESDPEYRIDYAIASKTWKSRVPVGYVLPASSVVAECTAIGFTAKGTEQWPGECKLHIECVGSPPYPGRSLPRVLGLLAHPDDVAAAIDQITYLTGDALTPRGSPPQIIAHIVNDRSGTWGGGFAKAAANKYPDAQIDFRYWTQQASNHKLGNVHWFGSKEHLSLASMVAQQGYGKSHAPRIRYPALETCLREVASRAIESHASVHMPRIGCGAAGGRWEVIEEFVYDTLVAQGVDVVVYDLP